MIEPMVERVNLPPGAKSFEWIMPRGVSIASDEPGYESFRIDNDTIVENACSGVIVRPDKAAYHSCEDHSLVFFVVNWNNED